MPVVPPVLEKLEMPATLTRLPRFISIQPDVSGRLLRFAG